MTIRQFEAPPTGCLYHFGPTMALGADNDAIIGRYEVAVRVRIASTPAHWVAGPVEEVVQWLRAHAQGIGVDEILDANRPDARLARVLALPRAKVRESLREAGCALLVLPAPCAPIDDPEDLSWAVW